MSTEKINPKNTELNLTEGHIPTLLKRIAMPASIGFFFSTMYNVVDTFYAGEISTVALAALSLSWPLFFILIAFGSGTSTGNTAVIGAYLGSGDKEVARKFAAQGVVYGIIISIFVSLSGLLFSKYLFLFLGAEGEYLQYCLEYMNIIFLGAPFMIGMHSLNSILQSRGDTRSFGYALVMGFFLNLILDPWFIYGGFGVPAMGIKGVAVATVFIFVIQNIFLIYRVRKTKIMTGTKLSDFIPSMRCILKLAEQGLAASFNMITVAIGIFVIQFFVSQYGKEAVAAFGTAVRIEQIALLPTIGINIGVLSLVSQNFGAKKFKRIQEILKTGLRFGFTIMTIGSILVISTAHITIRIFTDDVAVIEAGKYYLWIDAVALPAYVMLFLYTGCLQGIKRPKYTLYIAALRQLILPVTIFGTVVNVLSLPVWSMWIGLALIVWISAIVARILTNKVLEKVTNST